LKGCNSASSTFRKGQHKTEGFDFFNCNFQHDGLLFKRIVRHLRKSGVKQTIDVKTGEKVVI
jgi:hypothetical protein